MFRFKRLHIQNFQTLRERQTIEVAPLTFVFGSNSAGKSAIADALQFFGALMNGTATLQQLKRWRTVGDGVDGPTVIGVGIEYDNNIDVRRLLYWFGLGNPDQAYYESIDADEDPELWFLWRMFSRDSTWLGKKKPKTPKSWKGTIDVVISTTPVVPGSFSDESVVTTLKIILDDIDLITLQGEFGNHITLNRQHPAIAKKQHLFDLWIEVEGVYESLVGSLPERAQKAFVTISDEEIALKKLFLPVNGLHLSPTFSKPMGTLDPYVMFFNYDDDWLTFDESMDYQDRGESYLGAHLPSATHQRIDSLRRALTGIVVYPARIAGAIALNTLRVGPVRCIPTSSDLTWVKSAPARDMTDGGFAELYHGDDLRRLVRSSTDWSDGRQAWENLAFDEGKRRRVNEWLKSIGIGAQVIVRSYKLVPLVDDQLDLEEEVLKKHRERERNAVPPITFPSEKSFITTLFLQDEKTKSSVEVSDVGAGISQVIPILASLQEPSVIRFIEQPELHLHPKMQLVLADVFAQNHDETGKRKKKDFWWISALEERETTIIETHSEHMALRVLNRIRGGKKAGKKNRLLSTDVMFLYFRSAEDGTRAYQIRVDSRGRFVDQWPEGFFSERIDEIL